MRVDAAINPKAPQLWEGRDLQRCTNAQLIRYIEFLRKEGDVLKSTSEDLRVKAEAVIAQVKAQQVLLKVGPLALIIVKKAKNEPPKQASQ